jgi:hypothetical protein
MLSCTIFGRVAQVIGVAGYVPEVVVELAGPDGAYSVSNVEWPSGEVRQEIEFPVFSSGVIDRCVVYDSSGETLAEFPLDVIKNVFPGDTVRLDVQLYDTPLLGTPRMVDTILPSYTVSETHPLPPPPPPTIWDHLKYSDETD